MTPWYANLFTGLCTRFGPVAPRPHDPELYVCSASVPSWTKGEPDFDASGIGLTPDAAEAACAGEAIERLAARPMPDDQIVNASHESWSKQEPAVPPSAWVLFHAEQFRHAGFPFRQFTPQTNCAWVRCRDATSGQPMWVPAEMVYLNLRPGVKHQITPGLSTGLSCGRWGQPVVLRGLQEVIERDAVVGAWWGRYKLEEHPLEDVVKGLEPRDHWRTRLLRPNLHYRCYRVQSPFSSFVTLVTLAGDDREGFCFSVGSACRETLALSWAKSFQEAVHGRHYVRLLKDRGKRGEFHIQPEPASFAEHAVYYSLFPQRLVDTVLYNPSAPTQLAVAREGLAELQKKLGPDRPVLVRSLTPPFLAQEGLDWQVVRVVVPRLQPLHGVHRLAHLGGPLWSPRGAEELAHVPPHPFP